MGLGGSAGIGGSRSLSMGSGLGIGGMFDLSSSSKRNLIADIGESIGAGASSKNLFIIYIFK